MSEKLLPCPFCGNPGTSEDWEDGRRMHFCLNGKCPAHDLDCTEEEWNTRAPSPALDKLRELVDRILELDAKATKGRWKSKLNHAPYKCVFINEREHYSTLELKPEDADLIAEYRTLAPELARALRAIEELNQPNL